jgi:hypothetical protein
MGMAHKQDEKVFRLAEMRFASAFKVIDDETGAALGTTVAIMENDPDSRLAYLTEDDGLSFWQAGWRFREFPFPPTLIQVVDRATVETDDARIADLRLILAKWRKLINPD